MLLVADVVVMVEALVLLAVRAEVLLVLVLVLMLLGNKMVPKVFLRKVLKRDTFVKLMIFMRSCTVAFPNERTTA